MTKPSEHEVAHSLSEAADQARQRREWQMSNRPKLPEQKHCTLCVWIVIVVAVTFLAVVTLAGCTLSGVCK